MGLMKDCDIVLNKSKFIPDAEIILSWEGGEGQS